MNESGTIVSKDDYYPFGLQMDGFSYVSGNAGNNNRYSGKELDEEGSLARYHYGWREYDAELSRWNVIDPVRQWGSPYAFNRNNPVNLYDPDGRLTTDYMFIYIWAHACAAAREYETATEGRAAPDMHYDGTAPRVIDKNYIQQSNSQRGYYVYEATSWTRLDDYVYTTLPEDGVIL